MNQYKLGVGPMSAEIIEAIVSYKHKDKLMVVASRNQVDYTGGYVCTPYELALKIKPAGIFLCRDHCGPYFKDSDRDLSLDKALAECKKTIEHDLKAGFDLIHIDISKIDDPKFLIAKELIDYAKSINPNVLFEFGSEENTGVGIADSIARLIPQLEFVSQFPEIKYFVSQTGSLTKNRQAGVFEIGPNTVLAQTIHSYGLLFKEHNADYLTKEGVALRTLVGVDAMNIAPQLGYLQTCLLEELCAGTSEWDAFSEIVYRGNMWRRWATPGEEDRTIAVRAGGHYHFGTPQYKALRTSIMFETAFETRLKEILHNLFDLYLGINTNEII